MKRRVCAVAYLILAGCARVPSTPDREPPQAPTPAAAPAPAASVSEKPTGWRQRGRISLYGNAFAGKPTASGETFDPERLTMAHRTLPFGTMVRVTNAENQQSVEVVVNDRGPYVEGRIADLSTAAARRIGMVIDGVVEGIIEVIQPSKAR